LTFKDLKRFISNNNGIDNNKEKEQIASQTVCLNKIYNTEDIEKEKNQPYFQRECMLAYSIGTGNVFSEQSIIYASDLGEQA